MSLGSQDHLEEYVCMSTLFSELLIDNYKKNGPLSEGLDVRLRALHFFCHLILSSTSGYRYFYPDFTDETEAERG